MGNQVDLALGELNRLSTEEALKVVEALKAKRLNEQYVKFFLATPAQRAVVAAFDKELKILGVLGGNRSGKTQIGAFIATAWALGKEYFRDEPAWEYVKDLPIPEPPNAIWVVGLDFPTLRDVIWREKLRYGRGNPPLVPKESLSKPPNDSDFQIFFANGSVITGKSADSGREKFQGASIDLVWIDEECEVGVFDECYQRTADCAGKLLLTLTPLTDIASGVREPWVYDLHEEARAGRKDVKFVSLSVLDNPHIPETEKVKLQEKWAGHPEERARLYGEFIQRSGLVYNLWNEDKHLVDPFKIPKDWRKIVSIDPANTGPTGALWCAINDKNDLYFYREYYAAGHTISDHAKEILVRTSGDAIDLWLIDPTWGRQRDGNSHRTGMQLYRDAGIPARLAEVGEDYGLNESREYIAATIEGATARHPRCFFFRDLKEFSYQIEHYIWDYFQKGPLKGMSKDKPKKGGDDLINCFQYLAAQRPKARRATSIYGSAGADRTKLNSYT